MSKYEDKVYSVLRANLSSPILREYQFKDLSYKGKYPLRFDFAILNHDYKPAIMVEVDGEQHFQHISHFGERKNFKHYQENDRRKNKYCLLNKIKLIRIPYWDLETITFEKIFNTPAYVVTSIYHNDNLINNRT